MDNSIYHSVWSSTAWSVSNFVYVAVSDLVIENINSSIDQTIKDALTSSIYDYIEEQLDEMNIV